MMRGLFFSAVAIGCFSAIALAQTSGTEKKSEPMKGKDDDTKTKPKEKGTPKSKFPLEKLLTPSGTIIVIVDELREAMAMYPDRVFLTPEAYEKMREQIKALERQLAQDRAAPSSCKLVGKQDGEVIQFSAEIGFATLQPKASVMLGFKGAHLTDEGSLDGQAANLEYTDDGYVIRVEKEGPHRLTLNFRVAAPIKKSAGNALERAAKFEMPGAAATTLTLELPRGVEDLTWNEIAEKAKSAGRWEMALGPVKSLALSWKEPTANTGNAPLAKVDGLITVRVEDAAINIAAELFLEDLRPFSKEWLLWLPAQAKIVDVKGPNGVSSEWKNPGNGTPYFRIPGVSPGKWQVTITQRLPRPTNVGARVPIGPFHVLGAFQHLGTITVHMPAEVSFGQRLNFSRSGATALIKSSDTESVFHYAMPIMTEKMPKTPVLTKASLELDWRNEKNQLESQVEHALKLKTTSQGWEIEAMTRIKASALFSPFNSLDLKLPLPRPRGLSVVGTVAPGLGLPGAVPWGGIWRTLGMPLELAQAEDLTIQDENANPLKLMPQDATGKVRVISERPASKQMTVVVKNTFVIPTQNQRVRLDLPRPLNFNDQRAKLTIDTDERVEILHGLAGAEEPVPDRHHFDLSWDQAPSQVELAWRPFQREVIAQSTIDITLFEHSAMVKQKLQFPRDTSTVAADAKHQQLRLLVPRGVGKISVLSGGEITSRDAARQLAWLHPAEEGQDPVEVVLQYDLALTKPAKSDAADNVRTLSVAPIWPAHASLKDAKVRVWASPAALPRLPKTGLQSTWKERSIEAVAGKDQFPAIVLQGYGTNIPLTLRIDEGSATQTAAFVADRALMEFHLHDDESQHCRARYWLRKTNASFVEVELPMPLSRFREPPTFLLGRKVLLAEKKDSAERIVLLKLHPDLVAMPAILEINYTIPAEALDRGMPWRTALMAPAFLSDVVIGQMRWLFDAPGPLLAFSLNRNVRPEIQWSVAGWLLTPETAVTSVEMESWLTGKENAPAPDRPVYAFALIRMQPETVYHLPRHWWLLGCSSVFLIVTLGGYFSPMPRLAYWLTLFGLALAALGVGVFWPALLPPLAFGLQPGLVLFVAFVGGHWLIQERYRRQLVFMPGFVRPKTGSTMVRTNSPKRAREASTVDAPTAAAEANAVELPEPPAS